MTSKVETMFKNITLSHVLSEYIFVHSNFRSIVFKMLVVEAKKTRKVFVVSKEIVFVIIELQLI